MHRPLVLSIKEINLEKQHPIHGDTVIKYYEDVRMTHGGAAEYHIKHHFLHVCCSELWSQVTGDGRSHLRLSTWTQASSAMGLLACKIASSTWLFVYRRDRALLKAYLSIFGLYVDFIWYGMMWKCHIMWYLFASRKSSPAIQTIENKIAYASINLVV